VHGVAASVEVGQFLRDHGAGAADPLGAPRVAGGARPRRADGLSGGADSEPLEHPNLEPDRRPGGRQQFEQPAAGRRQLTYVLAAGPALLQVRDRCRALAPGERAERQLGGHVV
jgi:hypothetical protein